MSVETLDLKSQNALHLCDARQDSSWVVSELQDDDHHHHDGICVKAEALEAGDEEVRELDGIKL